MGSGSVVSTEVGSRVLVPYRTRTSVTPVLGGWLHVSRTGPPPVSGFPEVTEETGPGLVLLVDCVSKSRTGTGLRGLFRSRGSGPRRSVTRGHRLGRRYPTPGTSSGSTLTRLDPNP